MGVAEQECGQIREMWYIYIAEHDTYIYIADPWNATYTESADTG